MPIRRKRLPRGRHVTAARDQRNLRERVGRLEALISNLDSTRNETSNIRFSSDLQEVFVDDVESPDT